VNTAAQEALDEYQEALIASAPVTWIRGVVWRGRLVETDGSPAGTDKTVAVCVAHDGTELSQSYLSGSADGARAMMALQEALVGEPEDAWTVLRIEIDRDGQRRVDFSHEPARRLEDSSEDEFWDDVHKYLERNRTELEQFVERLREQGDLPEANGDKGGGRLGKLFGRR
jgi:hypothetical protein